MATKTFTQLTAVTTLAAGDELVQWNAAAGAARKITVANFIANSPNGGLAETGAGNSFSVLQTFAAGLRLGAGVDTLNNYEVGTWTPTLTFGAASVGITYTTQSGRYVRVGNIIHLTMYIVLTSKGSSTGTAVITGVPVAAASTIRVAGSLWGTGITHSGFLMCYLPSSGTEIRLQSLSTVAAISSTADTDFSNSSTLAIQLTYQI